MEEVEQHTKYGLRARVVHRRYTATGVKELPAEKDREAIVAAGLNHRGLTKAERQKFGGRVTDYTAARCAS